VPPSDENVQDIVINPYYAVNFSDRLFRKHTPAGIKEDWVQVNTELIGELGSNTWLVHLLACLGYKNTGKIGAAINPCQVIVVSDRLRGTHEPLISADGWVTANVVLMREMGCEAWLWQLLDVLESGGPMKKLTKL
jgi:hypothetical protein